MEVCQFRKGLRQKKECLWQTGELGMIIKQVWLGYRLLSLTAHL